MSDHIVTKEKDRRLRRLGKRPWSSWEERMGERIKEHLDGASRGKRKGAKGIGGKK